MSTMGVPAGDNLELLEIPDSVSSKQTKSKGETTKKINSLIKRVFSKEGVSPYNEIKWEKREAFITNDKGEVIFNQKDVEVPAFWSQTATNIVASKYLWGTLGTAERETGIRQLIKRVADTLTEWGLKDKYFTLEESKVFNDELSHILLNQKAAFNSPVWFNLGIEENPQCSACFINSVEDTLGSIMDLAKTEGMLFKYGSGTGTNLSVLRSSKEKLSGGGTASGPVSFMRGYDAFAGVIKSGGKTRRAAKMVMLNADHPDIVEFINCKRTEEEKAIALINAGYDPAIGGEAYSSIAFQNGNNSVRVPDSFMKAYEEDREWYTKEVKTGKTVEIFRAHDIMKMISESTHVCGDPGMQYDTTINKWHTCKETDRIYASNPCSEFMFLNDTACNLASLNLLRFVDEDGTFDVEAFKHAINILIFSQEILVSNAGYPRDVIAENSEKFRPLGLGYANLGALFMSSGLPYDSDEGRALAAAITALMTGQAYHASAQLAGIKGAFQEFELNRNPMLEVIKLHRNACLNIDSNLVPSHIYEAAKDAWDTALKEGKTHGYRNSQVSVLAPTGTIGFMMDCDTTGIEPELALVKFKNLAGGGNIKLVNQTIPKALAILSYDENQISEIVGYLEKTATVENAPHIKKEHLAIFDCAFKPANGTRFIHHMGHIKMMAAVQPFISGAISKTVNVPEETTAEEIADAYYQGWKLGLKAIAIYRDNSKGQQVLSTKSGLKDKTTAQPIRRKLPPERRAITHKFSIAGHEGYITVGMYENGMPGEIFLVMAKEGSTISGLMDSFATAVSMALQYGVPLEVLVKKFSYTRFEPSGYTGNKDVVFATSIMDYIFRWLGAKFLNTIPEDSTKSIMDDSDERIIKPDQEQSEPQSSASEALFQNQEDSPPCHACGAIMVRSGSCYKCLNCGETSGCS